MAQNDVNTWGGAANSAATAFAPVSSFTQAPAVYAQAGAPAPGAAQMTGRHKNPGRMPRTGGGPRMMGGGGIRPRASMSALARPAQPAAPMGDPMMAMGSTPAIPGSEAPMGTPAPTMGAPGMITGSTPAIPGSEAPVGAPAPTMGGGFAALKQKLSQSNTGFSPNLGIGGL